MLIDRRKRERERESVRERESERERERERERRVIDLTNRLETQPAYLQDVGRVGRVRRQMRGDVEEFVALAKLHDVQRAGLRRASEELCNGKTRSLNLARARRRESSLSRDQASVANPRRGHRSRTSAATMTHASKPMDDFDR